MNSTQMEAKDNGIIAFATPITTNYKKERGSKPRALSNWTLSSLLVATFVLIALVEVACRGLAAVNGKGVFKDVNDRISDTVRRDLDDFGLTKTVIAIDTYEVVDGRLARAAAPQVATEEISISQSDLEPPSTAMKEVSVLQSTLPVYPSTTQQSHIVSSVPPSSAHLHTSPTTTSAPNTSAYFEPTGKPPTAPPEVAFLNKMGPVSSSGDYFLGTYLPTFMAVLYGIPWIILSRNVNAVEPFYQLSRPRGASASSTLTVDYQSISAPVRAFFYGQWPVVIASAISYISLLIVPLAPETVYIHLIGECNAKTVGCAGKIGVFTPTARVIQALLALIAIFLIFLMVIVNKRKSDLVSDPRSLAGLATLLRNPQTQRDFTALRSQINDKELRFALATYTYRLQSSIHSDGSQSIDLVRMNDGGTDVAHPSPPRYDYTPVDWSDKAVTRHRPLCIGFSIYLIALMVLIVFYCLVGDNSGFERFMDSQDFGVRFLFTMVGVSISLLWKHIFQDIASMTPYRTLSMRNASARSSILLKLPIYPLISLSTALRNADHVLALVSLSAILAEILTVSLATIPFNSANLHTAYIVSTWLSVAIISIMLVTLVTLFWYREPKLSVEPRTMAAHLYYLSPGQVPKAMMNLGGLLNRNRDERVVALRYRFGLGMVQGSDGASRVGIDVET